VIATVQSGATARSPGRWLLFVGALTFGALTIAIIDRVDLAPPSHASRTTSAAIMDIAAGLGLILAGGLSMLNQHRARVGTLAVAAGIVWLATDWVAWVDGPLFVRSLAMVAAPLLLPILLHLAAAYPSGHLSGPRARRSVAAAYIVSCSVSLTWALVRDPFRERYCWNNCTGNSFLVHANAELARTVTTWWRGSTFIVALAFAALCVWRLARATSVTRRVLAPALLPVAVMGVVQLIYGIALLNDPAESTGRQPFPALFAARAATLIALAAGIIVAIARELRRRRAVAGLADELGAAPEPGSLQAALRRSLGDDSLDVYYWLPGRGGYVDAAGYEARPRPLPDQMITPVVRNGERVAAVVHDRTLPTVHDLEREISASSRLAIDNERLVAQSMAQLADLRASRARIIEAADDSRRRLERDLHDGAQQRMLGLSYALQLALADAEAAGDLRLTSVLQAANDEMSRAFDALRDLAHGIFPVILADAGIAPALGAFAATAPIRVELNNIPKRLDTEIESAAYMTITKCAEEAATRSARSIAVTFDLAASEIVLTIDADSTAFDPDELVPVSDRVGSLGGRVDIAGSRLTAVLPCAS
jgi:signal transduction histidine kinase